MNRNKCVIIVPIYKEQFNDDEYYSINNLFNILPVSKYDIIAICPISLDISYYQTHYNFTDYYVFYDSYFSDYPKGYNSLMLNSGFYDMFSKYEYMLIHQPDCWVFKDELEYWCNKGYDYIGAPEIYRPKYYIRNYCHIGNGGFSLRKISWWKFACEEYKYECQETIKLADIEYGEDRLITGLKGYGIQNINIPSFIEAAYFSFNTNPNLLYQIIGHQLPFGCHAYKTIRDSFFWNDFIFYDKKRYSVITFLFGDYDILREPDEIDPNAEYICITDRDDLKSNIWEFKKLNFPNIEKYNNWQKTLIARYTALDYITTKHCFKIDASVHIKKSLYNLMNICDGMNICVMPHPYRTDYLIEFDEWIRSRNLNPIQKRQFIEYCNRNNYNIKSQGFIMTTIMYQANNDENKKLNNEVLYELMNNFDFNIRVDQCYFSLIYLNKYFNKLQPIKCFSPQVLESSYFEYFYHGEIRTHNGEYPYNLTKIDYKLMNDLYYPCLYLV